MGSEMCIRDSCSAALRSCIAFANRANTRKQSLSIGLNYYARRLSHQLTGAPTLLAASEDCQQDVVVSDANHHLVPTTCRMVAAVTGVKARTQKALPSRDSNLAFFGTWKATRCWLLETQRSYGEEHSLICQSYIDLILRQTIYSKIPPSR